MKDFTKRLRDDWQFLTVAVTTAAVGINFLVSPNLLDDHSAYAFIVNVIDDAAFSIPILIAGILGSLFFVLDKKKFRSAFLIFYQFVWMILFLAYSWRAFTGHPNSSWIMALTINIAFFLIALWGDFDGK